MELHILELKKLPAEDQNEEGVIRWMRFLSGKTRKEFEDMAKKDEYIEEAYNELKKLSLDEKKRLEYEARERALHDYNTQMQSAERRGEKRGIEIGEKRGEHTTLMRLAVSMEEKGKSPEETAEILDLDTAEVTALLKEYKQSVDTH